MRINGRDLPNKIHTCYPLLISWTFQSLRYLVLYMIKFDGNEKAEPVCDMLTLDDGLIVRIENCCDVTKIPKDIVAMGNATVAEWKASQAS